MAFATQADLEIAVGGAKRLLELADFGKTGQISDSSVQTVITGWLEEGASRVLQSASIKHDPETLAALDSPSLAQCRRWNKSFSGRLAYRDGAAGLAMPEQLAAGAAEADTDIEKLGRGEIRLARVAGGRQPALNQIVGVVDYDPQGTGMSVTALRRGFR